MEQPSDISFSARCWPAPSLLADLEANPLSNHLGYKSPNEKLNYAAIGAGGKGYSDIMSCQSENLVAMADPDEKRAERTFKLFPNVPKYKDFQQMLDKEKSIDAMLVACPDHMHGTVAMR